MSVYYNENDPFMAAWLKELMLEGMISKGDVDERSITEVTPKDLEGYVRCHFFAGIGVWDYAGAAIHTALGEDLFITCRERAAV